MVRMPRLIVFILAFAVTVTVAAQQPPPQAPPSQVTVWTARSIPAEKIDTDTIAKIRTEGMERSKIMWIEHTSPTCMDRGRSVRPTTTPRRSGR